jgi:hypothetical protein
MGLHLVWWPCVFNIGKYCDNVDDAEYELSECYHFPLVGPRDLIRHPSFSYYSSQLPSVCSDHHIGESLTFMGLECDAFLFDHGVLRV